MIKIDQEIKTDNMDGNEKDFNYFLNELNKTPFITIIGKYDHILGPRSVFSSIKLKDEKFLRNLLRDALNTTNKFVILNFAQFYAQIYKINIADKSARGGKQLYSVIIIRHMDSPLIPEIHFKRIEMLFRKIGEEKILGDDHSVFESFYNEIKKIYINKNEIVPFESLKLQIRSGVNTIQGFCELIREKKKGTQEISDSDLMNYINLMLDACDDIVKALEEDLQGVLK